MSRSRQIRIIGLLMAFAQFGHTQTNSPIPPNGDLKTPYRVEIVASRLQAPWSVVFAPNGRIFFSERPGWVRVILGTKVLEEPALVLKEVVPSVKMGLLGLALSPGFQTNGHVFLAYNYDSGGERFRMRVARYTERENRLGDPLVLLEGIPAYRNHTGGRLRFGPDGCLYIATGDANVPDLSQKLDSLAGKILRLQPDGSIPKDNPFAHRSDMQAAIWSYGHRNPQGLDFHPDTGALFAPEHGPDHGDELNLVEKGANYGWPVIHHRQKRDGLRNPALEFTPAIGPAAASFYHGSAFPELKGNLLVGCLRGEGILNITFSGSIPVNCERLLHRQFGRIREVTVSPEGFVYFTTSQFDPPEGTPRPDYDYILRLVPGSLPPTGLQVANRWNGPETAIASFDPKTRDPQELIAAYCAACHGPGLQGGMQRGLLRGDMQYAMDDNAVRKVILEGLGNKGMPAFTAALETEQVNALVRYLREKRNASPASGN